MERWGAFEVGWVIFMVAIGICMVIDEVHNPGSNTGCGVHVSASAHAVVDGGPAELEASE